MKRPIAISLSPNAEKDDVLVALRSLLSPISWYDFRETERLESEFELIYGKNYKALAVNSGRSALYLILKTIGLGPGDEVIVQGFTCVAVPNAVLWLGAKPVYVDVGYDFNIDAKDLSEKISENTKAIIVQHSFGVPADMDVLKKIAKKRSIPIIEDCALSMGAAYKGSKVGTIADHAFFSFGRDKVISSVFGGMILTRNKVFFQKISDERMALNYPPPFWVIQQIMHPILFAVILPFYNFGFGKLKLGKVMLFLFQNFGFLSKAVYKDEHFAKRPKYFPAKMPGVLAKMALNQLSKLHRFNTHRKKISSYYFKSLKGTGLELPEKSVGAVWMRFPILTKGSSSDLFNFMKKRGFLLGDWYKAPIVPVQNLNIVDYKNLDCINAEKYSRRIINLPTYPTLTINDAGLIVKNIKICLSTK